MATHVQTTVPPQYYGNQYPPQQAGIVIAPNTVASVQTVNTAVVRTELNYLALRKNSVIQMTLGILIGIFGIVATCIGCALYDGAGIWQGVLIVCAASFGLGASSTSGNISQKNCCIVTCNVCSIIAGLNALSISILACIAASVEPSGYYYYYYSRSARIGIDITIALLSILEMAAALWAVILTSKAGYCPQRQTVVMTQPAVQYNTGFATVQHYPPQQQAVFVNTPGLQPPPQYGQPTQAYVSTAPNPPQYPISNQQL